MNPNVQLENLRKDLEWILQQAISTKQTFNELKKKADTIFSKAPQIMQPITTVDFTRILEIETDKIWQKKIIGKADVEISKLIQKLNLIPAEKSRR